MITQAAVDDFLSQKALAVVGVSRGGKKFGNTILQELSAKWNGAAEAKRPS